MAPVEASEEVPIHPYQEEGSIMVDTTSTAQLLPHEFYERRAEWIEQLTAAASPSGVVGDVTSPIDHDGSVMNYREVNLGSENDAIVQELEPSMRPWRVYLEYPNDSLSVSEARLFALKLVDAIARADVLNVAFEETQGAPE
ncbi:hypothetical protein [Cnuibacter physcomitrellae]|nr:hypothetical protein [Cnuibacter physcomitrellae]